MSILSQGADKTWPEPIWVCARLAGGTVYNKTSFLKCIDAFSQGANAARYAHTVD
jgi:hypothetical protein